MQTARRHLTTGALRTAWRVGIAMGAAGWAWAGLWPASGYAQTPDAPSVIVVFDGSGSMAAPLAATRLPKAGIAREALVRGLQRMPAQMRVGLAAFGHRRGDCSDIEVMRGAEPVDAPRTGQLLEKLSPRGRGPLTQALRVAARALPESKAQRSLILIHDDADNCMADLCAAAAELARAKIVVHAIGLALKPEDRPKMACLSQITGGRIYNATTPEEVGSSIEEALKLASAELQKPAAPVRALDGRDAAAEVPETAPPGLYLRAKLSATSPPLNETLQWSVTPEGDNRIPVFDERAANPYLKLAPGKYVVELRDGPLVARGTVDVGKEKPTVMGLALDGGILRARVQAQKSGLSLPRVVVTLAALRSDSEPALASPPGEVVGALQGTEGNMLLPAGRYLVRAEAGLVRSQRVVTVAPGADVAADLTLVAGVLQLAAAAAYQNTSPVFIVLEDDPDAPKGRREVIRSAERTPEFVLPPGSYTVVMRQGDVETRERVALSSGDVARRILAVAGAQVGLSSRLGAQALEDHVIYRIERIDGTSRELITVSRPQPVLLLPAGRYRVEGHYGPVNARIAREIEVRTGAPLQQVVFEQQAGDVRLRAVNAPGEVFWEVRDASGVAVWSTGQPEPELTLQAGRYTVRAMARDKRAEVVLDVRTGEKRVAEVGFE